VKFRIGPFGTGVPGSLSTSFLLPNANLFCCSVVYFITWYVGRKVGSSGATLQNNINATKNVTGWQDGKPKINQAEAN
jgi:hypothetical protein